MHEVLERLLEAQLQHELSRWRTDTLTATVRGHVAALFRWCATVKLDDVVTRAQILGVIERYVIELRVSGGITELTGDMTRLVFGSRIVRETRVDQVIAPASYEEFADKVVALDGVRRQLIALVAHTTTFASINVRMLARSLLELLVPTVPIDRGRWVTQLLELAENLGKRLAPPVERWVAELLTAYLEHHREEITQAIEKHLLSVLDPERVRSLLDEVWDVVAKQRLSETFAVIGEQDLEDFVVLIYEFWLRYRKSDFFGGISSEMTDYFFRKYGQETLFSLIEDMGVNERMVSEELTGFLRPMLEHAAQSGALEAIVRARLLAFYDSHAAASALAG